MTAEEPKEEEEDAESSEKEMARSRAELVAALILTLAKGVVQATRANEPKAARASNSAVANITGNGAGSHLSYCQPEDARSSGGAGFGFTGGASLDNVSGWCWCSTLNTHIVQYVQLFSYCWGLQSAYN